MTVGQAVDDAGNDKNDDEDDINVDVIGSRQQFLQVRTGTKYYKLSWKSFFPSYLCTLFVAN